MESPLKRGLVALAGALLVNGLLIAGMTLWLESGRAPRCEPDPRERRTIPFVERPKPKKDERPRRSSPTRKQNPRANLPALNLASAISIPAFETEVPGAGAILHPGSNKRFDPLGVGAILTEDTVDEAPKPVERAALRYPRSAERDGIEGQVEARILLEVDGTVSQVRILSSNPPGIFEDAARDSLARWRFSPATFRGERVRVWVRQKLVFELR